MSVILNSLNAHNFPIFQLILMKLVSKSMIYRGLSYKTYLSLGLRSPLKTGGSLLQVKSIAVYAPNRAFCNIKLLLTTGFTVFSTTCTTILCPAR